MSKWTMMIYGLGDLASQFVWTFVGTYLTVFYTDIVGLAPLAVSMIMLLARLWDGINDPIMGMIAERTRSKFGRFRPYVLFGAPLLALFSVLTFTSPFGNGTAGVIWASVIYTIAGMLYTMVNIPYGALAAVMTEDANERNELNAWRSIGMNVGMIVVNSLSAVLMLRFSEGSAVADGRGYFTTAMIYALISLPMFLGVFLTSKEVIQPTNQEKVSMKETMRNIFGNKYLMILFLIMVLQMTAFMGLDRCDDLLRDLLFGSVLFDRYPDDHPFDRRRSLLLVDRSVGEKVRQTECPDGEYDSAGDRLAGCLFQRFREYPDDHRRTCHFWYLQYGLPDYVILGSRFGGLSGAEKRCPDGWNGLCHLWIGDKNR